MAEVRSFEICRDNYESEDEMWNDIGNISKILIRQQYEVLIRCDDADVGVCIVEYAYDPNNSEMFGCDRYMLVTEDEQEHIIEKRICTEGDESVEIEEEVDQ